MKKSIKILLSILMCFVVLIVCVPTGIYFARGNYSGVELPENFENSVQADVFDNNADIRIMSSNLLVHYKSWGGTPAKPRAKEYVELLENYSPDVIGVQEMSDSWYCLLRNNLPSGYKMLYPFTSGAFVRMTAVIYNSDTLNLVDSGIFAYKNGDNPRLRRVVWGVFEVKGTGKRFALTNTHFDLLRDGRETELREVMLSQTDELSNKIYSLADEYDCPVFSTGDYNTMEDTPYTKDIDIPEIYNLLSSRFVDSKFNCQNQVCGTEQDWDYPSYDHIFVYGNAEVDTFALLSYKYLSDMSDHYPVFADIDL